MVVGPQNQTSAPFGSCLHTPISNLHSFPCFHPCLCKSVLQPVFKVILEGKTWIEPLSDSHLEKKSMSLQWSVEPYLIWVPAVPLTPPPDPIPLTAFPTTAEAPSCPSAH